MELIAYTGTFVVFQDLDAIINQAREAEDVEAVDDWFADSLTEMYHKQHALLLRRYYNCRETKSLYCIPDIFWVNELYSLFLKFSALGHLQDIRNKVNELYSLFLKFSALGLLQDIRNKVNELYSLFLKFSAWAFFRILEIRSMNCIYSFSNLFLIS